MPTTPLPPVPAGPWTRAGILALPADGTRRELVDGVLLVTPAPTHLHQKACALLYDALRPYLRDRAVGDLLWSPADLTLGEDEVLQPDLFVILPRHAAPGVPWEAIDQLLLAVEVVSPASARADRTVKRRRYQRAGVPEYWVVDPDARLVERWRPGDDRPEVLIERLTWQPDPATPPLEVDLTALFETLWR